MSQTLSKGYPWKTCIICKISWPLGALTKEGICPRCFLKGGLKNDEL